MSSASDRRIRDNLDGPTITTLRRYHCGHASKAHMQNTRDPDRGEEMKRIRRKWLCFLPSTPQSQPSDSASLN